MITPPSHTAKIRQALTLAFDDVSFNAFCFDYFANVYDKFAEGMRRDQKIILLLDYCRRLPRGFEGLLEAVRQDDQGEQNQALKPLIEALEAHLKQLSEIEQIEEIAEGAPSKVNSYTPNPFFGRSKQIVGFQEQLWRIFGKLRAGNHCSIVGLPGSGKSALLEEVIKQLPQQMGCQAQALFLIRFRGITSLTELKEIIVSHLGGQKTNQIRSLMRKSPLRVLILDDLGGMDAGKRGYKMRRWLRGFAEQYQIRLLIASNDRLDILFRHDDPTIDSPFETLDRLPVHLAGLPPAECRQLVQERLANSSITIEHFADLLNDSYHPKDLLDACAARYEELRGKV